MVNVFPAADRRSIALVDTVAKLLGADPGDIRTDPALLRRRLSAA
jgi:hypothetical protein